MKYVIKYSPTALRDLDRVWREVLDASNDFEITQKYMNELIEKIEAKADYPRSGSPLYYENGFTGYYFVTYKVYIAFYRLDKNEILVDRVLYGASDYMRKLNFRTEE